METASEAILIVGALASVGIFGGVTPLGYSVMEVLVFLILLVLLVQQTRHMVSPDGYDDLPGLFSYRLLHDRLTEGFEIASRLFPVFGRWRVGLARH